MAFLQLGQMIGLLDELDDEASLALLAVPPAAVGAREKITGVRDFIL